MLYSKPLDVFKEFNDNPNLNDYFKQFLLNAVCKIKLEK